MADFQAAPPLFRCEPDPDMPGWSTWDAGSGVHFNAALGRLRVRSEEKGARVRMWPEPSHGNLNGSVHGGAVMALIDMALFAACRVQGVVSNDSGATIDLTVQFLRPAAIGQPLDAVPEILRETGSFVFLRGLAEQADETVAAFSGTVRKPRRSA